MTNKKSESAFKYRFVVIGDIHLRRTDPLGIVEEDGLNTRLKDKLSSLKFAIDYALDNDATHIEFLGDIFETINPSEKLKKLFWEIVLPAIKKKIEIRIIIGNHDSTGQIYNFAGDKLISPENIQIIDSAVFENLVLNKKEKSFKIHHIPYSKKEIIQDNLQKGVVEKIDVTFGHFEIEGAQLAPDNTQIRQGVDKDSIQGRLIWLGHIHKFQEFRDGFAYIGSCVKCDFGETNNQKVFGKFDILDDGKIKCSYIDIPQRPMHQIEIREDDPNNLYISERIPKELKKKGILIKFIFIGSVEWVKTIDKIKFKKRFKNAIRVVTEDKKLDTDITRTEVISYKMEDRVHFYTEEKKKGKEHTSAGLEIVKEVQEIEA